MVDIHKAVGDLGVNASQDVALVQLMLRVVKNAKNQSYFAGDYNGNYDLALKAAIIAFQQDQKLLPAPAAGPAGLPGKVPLAKVPPPVAGPAEKAGQLGPTTKTLAQLIANLPADYKEIRIIPGSKTIYVPGDGMKATANAAKIRTEKQLNADFREKVAQLVEAVYKEHKLVLGIPGDGWRRDFAAQASVKANATGAGPGESPHQFGRAVDLGFASLKWVAGDGQFKVDNFWLDAQALPAAKSAEFWSARNAIAFNKLGLFKTNKAGDLIHVQGFDDGKVSWGQSLAKLLEAASPTKAKWSVVAGNPNRYKVDLGLGGSFTAGSANAIWGGKAVIDKTELVKAFNAKVAADPTFSIDKFFGIVVKAVPPVDPAKGAQPVGAAKGAPAVDPAKAAAAVDPAKAAAAKPAVLVEKDIADDKVTYLQQVLQAEIKAADTKWDQWTPTK